MMTVGLWLSDHAHLPRLDAELLLAHELNLTRAQIIAYPERTIDATLTTALQHLADRLGANEPLAYLTGHREFWGLTLAVSSAVLVPRPETELLVELALERAAHGARVLELGTGSGAIAVALGKERPDLAITATDKCNDALNIARRNAHTHDVAVDFVLADWFKPLHSRWDLIISNPPYVRPQDPHLAQLWAEPQHALVSPPDGMGDLTQIIGTARNFLCAQGHVMVEHGFDQASAVRATMREHGYHRVCSMSDLGNIERVTLGQHE